MPVSSFSSDQILPFWIAVVLLIGSIILWNWKKSIALLFLTGGAFSIAYFAAALDPFFWVWDEQYHAMVAKNLSSDFLSPMLYKDHPLPHDHGNWVGNSVWLHKQPLFLWQMALSIKIFDPSVMAIRLPSIVLFSILPLIIYRIGKITMNKNTGFYAALLFACSYFPLMLVLGSINTDHNDLVFLFYVTASFWAWFEYQESKKFYWLILIGIFSGFAVLTKWLMGLLIYVIWFGTKLLFEKETRFKIKTYLPMIYSGGITLLLFLPWQFYIFNKFPKEAQYEYDFNSKHFFEAVEGHEGTFWYHFQEAFDYMYGTGDGNPDNGFQWFYILILFGLFAMIFKIERRKYILLIFSSLVFVYLFFSIAATKMPAFTLIMMPFLFLAVAATLDTAFNLLAEKLKKPVLFSIQLVVLLLLMKYSFKMDRIAPIHGAKAEEAKGIREPFIRNLRFIHELKNTNFPEKAVIFNANVCYYGHIPVMFYTDIPTFQNLPSPEQVLYLKEQHSIIYVVKNGDIPSYLTEDPEIHILTPPL